MSDSPPLLVRDRPGDAALERRNAELLTAVDELRLRDSLKTRFLSNVSHDLRTPLSAMITHAENLRDGLLGELTGRDEPGQCRRGDGLATFVDAKMRLASRETSAADSMRVAVIAALNIADELFRAREDAAGGQGAIFDRAAELEKILDAVLAREDETRDLPHARVV